MIFFFLSFHFDTRVSCDIIRHISKWREDMREVMDVLKALADENRLRALCALRGGETLRLSDHCVVGLGTIHSVQALGDSSRCGVGGQPEGRTLDILPSVQRVQNPIGRQGARTTVQGSGEQIPNCRRSEASEEHQRRKSGGSLPETILQVVNVVPLAIRDLVKR